MRRVPLALAGVITILLAACGSAAPAAPTAISLSLTEFRFTPAPLQAAAGSSIKLGLRNAGAVEHDFTIDKLGLKILLKPGESAERSIGPLAPGTYEIICSIAGHREAGMSTQLTVK